jgi:VWFA-related protein
MIPVAAWADSQGVQWDDPNATASMGSNSSLTADLPLFRSNANLVMVPVVVRDAKGNAVGNLRRENFRILDNGKPQEIKQFSIELGATRTEARTSTGSVSTGEVKRPAPSAAARRYIAYVFDDHHLAVLDLVRARTAAERRIAMLEPGEHVALYTTSGRNTVEFTDDVPKLREALRRIVPKAKLGECPDIGPFWATQIQDAGYAVDFPVAGIALQELKKCPGNEGLSPGILQTLFRNTVERILAESDQDTKVSLSLLKSVALRMSTLPGERTAVMVSSGYLTRHHEERLAKTIEWAVQSRVVVNTLDARGLYVGPGFDASESRVPDPEAIRIRNEEASAQQDVMAELAQGTGGFFFHGNNDLNEGFRRTAGLAEYTYMIGFTPEISKDPKAAPYHQLSVKLEEAGHGLKLQARRGYMAGAQSVSPLEEERQQIRNALASGEEMREIPIKLSTEFSRTGKDEGSLRVTVHVDVKDLPLRKVDGRYSDDLEVHTGVYDRKGKLITSKGNRLELRLKEETVAQLHSGVALPQEDMDMDFDLKFGEYIVRVVVRAAESQLMAATNSSVKIP